MLQRQLTALPPPVTRLEALVLRGVTAELWEHFEQAERGGPRQPGPVSTTRSAISKHIMRSTSPSPACPGRSAALARS
jgi:hypothetical protein